MTRIDRRLGAAGCLALAAASLSLLTACTTTATGAEKSPTPTATADADAEFVAVAIDMPELPPYPEPGPPFAEAESEARRIADADAQWQGLLATYPDAVRPPDPFVGYATDEERRELLRTCLEASGIAIDEGRSTNPEDPPSIGWSTNSVDEGVAAYACNVAHPVKVTQPNANDAQLGWIYDYMVDFYAPCFEANGIEVAPPPGKDVWVQTYPGYVWFPSTGEDPRFHDMTNGAEEALREACPDPDTYLQLHPEIR